MRKIALDEQIPPVRVAAATRRALEAEAAADDRDLSSLVRRILTNHVAAKPAEQTHCGQAA
jgi:hypothetical protein